MANRLWTSQFSYSLEKQLVNLMGAFTQTVLRAKASLVNQGITYTAVNFGSAGNSITIQLIDPAANNQSLSILVTGTAISVSLATDSGGAITTTATALVAALTADIPSSALISASGSGASPLIALAQTPLTGGADTQFSDNLPLPVMSITQTGVGLYQITLQDKFMNLLSAQMMLQASSAKDLMPQLVSEDVANSKVINFRMITSATPTNLANSDTLYIDLKLRNIR